MATRRFSSRNRSIHLDAGPVGELRPVGYIPSVQEPEPGWLFANGAAISRATYERLFQKFSTAYGVGDGSSTFNLPDFQGRSMVFALNGAVGSSRVLGLGALGAVGGTESETLSVAQMPSHNHGGATATEGAHTHSGNTGAGTAHAHVYANALHGHTVGHGEGAAGGTDFTAAALGGGGFTTSIDDDNRSGGSINAESAHTHPFTTGAGTAHSHSIASQGGGSSHNNVHPHQVAGAVLIRY